MYISSNKDRSILMATYLIENNSTVRKVAAHFGISKSTVHKDITEILKNKNPTMYQQVKEILDKNKCERHIRGGEATRLKFLNKCNT